MLAELLVRLVEGDSIILDTMENQKGDFISSHELSFVDGKWVEGEINCISASDFGLGTCACNSHPAFVEFVVDRKRALHLLRDYIEREQKDMEQRAVEAAWIDAAIEELQAV